MGECGITGYLDDGTSSRNGSTCEAVDLPTQILYDLGPGFTAGPKSDPTYLPTSIRFAYPHFIPANNTRLTQSLSADTPTIHIRFLWRRCSARGYTMLQSDRGALPICAGCTRQAFFQYPGRRGERECGDFGSEYTRNQDTSESKSETFSVPLEAFLQSC